MAGTTLMPTAVDTTATLPTTANPSGTNDLHGNAGATITTQLT